jgi:hypothetical protein
MIRQKDVEKRKMKELGKSKEGDVRPNVCAKQLKVQYMAYISWALITPSSCHPLATAQKQDR